MLLLLLVLMIFENDEEVDQIAIVAPLLDGRHSHGRAVMSSAWSSVGATAARTSVRTSMWAAMRASVRSTMRSTTVWAAVRRRRSSRSAEVMTTSSGGSASSMVEHRRKEKSALGVMLLVASSAEAMARATWNAGGHRIEVDVVIVFTGAVMSVASVVAMVAVAFTTKEASSASRERASVGH